MAKQHGFVQRKGKIDAFKFVTSLMFIELEQSKLSLLDLKLDLLNHFGCEVSREAIHKRFTPQAVGFLKGLLGKLLSERLAEAPVPLKKLFNRVCIKDSSKFTIPKEFAGDYPGYNGFNSKSGLMNIQYEYDLQSGDWLGLDFTKATRNDQQDSKETLDRVEKNDLHIRDLGYVTLAYLKGVAKREAYFLNRLPASMNVYRYKNGECLLVDWQEIHKKMSRDNTGQMGMEVLLSKKEKLKARMVVRPVPEEVYAERIRKASKHAKSKGCKLSKEYRIKARYNIYITNVPESSLADTDIGQVYRLRWQIELVFKTWKSSLSVHRVKKVKRERFECQVLAKLLWCLVNWKFFQAANMAIKRIDIGSGLSIFKFYKQAIKYSQQLRALIGDKSGLKTWTKKIFAPLIPHLTIETKKGKIPHYQIFNDFLWELS